MKYSTREFQPEPLGHIFLGMDLREMLARVSPDELRSYCLEYDGNRTNIGLREFSDCRMVLTRNSRGNYMVLSKYEDSADFLISALEGFLPGIRFVEVKE